MGNDTSGPGNSASLQHQDIVSHNPSGVLGDGWLESVLTLRTGDFLRRMGTTADTVSRR